MAEKQETVQTTTVVTGPAPVHNQLVVNPQSQQQVTGAVYTSTITGPNNQQQTVITGRHKVEVNSVDMTEEPMTTLCPHCSQMVLTRTEYVSGSLTWLVVLGICLVGGVVGCCLIPFFIPKLQDVTHYCPNCSKHVGTKTRLDV